MESISDFVDDSMIEEIVSVYADKGYDAKYIRNYLRNHSIRCCIPYRNNSKFIVQRSKEESADQGRFVMILDDIIESISKEAIDEKDNIRQVIITILSSRSGNPQNLRILAPSGEGKTYTVLQTSQYFPQDDIMTISEASSKSFRYMAQSKVIEIDGKFVDFEEII